MTFVEQVLVGAGLTDAITNMARSIRRGLADSARGDIFARHPAVGVDDVLPLHRFDPAHTLGRVVVFHASLGDPDVFEALSRCASPIALVFHNLAPDRAFESIDPARAAALRDGWRELDDLRPSVAVAIADSTFNAACLTELGFRNVHVLPVGVEVHRLDRASPSPQFQQRVEQEVDGQLLLSVGQALPHKHLETLVQMQHILTEYGRQATSLAVVGPPTIPAIVDAITEQAAALNVPNCLFYGQVSDAELSVLFKRAFLFITASAHEGLCLPAIEAMASGLPVIARAAGALPETVGEAGILLPPDAGPELFAEAVRCLLDDNDLHARLSRAGRREVSRFDDEASLKAFLQILDDIT